MHTCKVTLTKASLKSLTASAHTVLKAMGVEQMLLYWCVIILKNSSYICIKEKDYVFVFFLVIFSGIEFFWY